MFSLNFSATMFFSALGLNNRKHAQVHLVVSNSVIFHRFAIWRERCL
jgi:hypothetical protein